MKNNKIIFVDFETKIEENNKYFGPINEISILTVIDGKITLEQHFIMDDGEYAEKVMKDIFKQKVPVVFWHNWMDKWLNLHGIETYGRSLQLCNLYALQALMEGKEVDSTISGMTKELLGRKHIGCAQQDVHDLYKCYQNLANKLLFNKE